MARRFLSILVAFAYTLEAPAQTHAMLVTTTPPAEVDAKAEALFEGGHYLAAAKEWEDALGAVDESLEVRAQRNGWATGAVNAYKAAFDANPARCAAIQKSLELADEYLATLVAVYSLPAKNADDYQGMSKRRGELDMARIEKGCGGPTSGNPPAPTSEPRTTQPAPVVVAPADSAEPVDESPRSETRRGNPGLAAGVGVSAALGVVMLTTSLVLYSQLRKGSGKYYEAIVEAAKQNNVQTDKDHDMCDSRSVEAIDSACNTWENHKSRFVATTVLAGLFGASTAVFTGLLIRKRRQSSTVALLREHHFRLGAAPRRDGGVMFVGGISF